MSLFDRFGTVVRSEWSARFGEDPDGSEDEPDEQALDESDDGRTGSAPSRASRTASSAASSAASSRATSRRKPPQTTSAARRPAQRRAPEVTDLQSAWRLLELTPDATLDQVRENYFTFARRYHPRTLSKVADQAYAAQTVLEALTDALELLEAHLLPLPDGRRG